VQPVVAGKPVFTRSLAVGSSGIDVRQLQIVLNNAGIIVASSGAGSAGKESDYFGPATRSALLKFQRSRSLTADGQLNADTIAYVNKMVVSDPAKLVPLRAVASPSTAGAPVSSVTNPVNTSVRRTTSSIRKGLALGASGEDVRTLQILLNSTGIVVAQSGIGSKGKESTVFGPATKSALLRFQRTYRIPSTGYVDGITLRKLAEVTGK
jgi:peptidoglycan hydrolase-like protein with peptidoglycan-binding domain